MGKKPHNTQKAAPRRWYRGADVPMSLIRRFARQVAERFQPDMIILFGSYAYGVPHADSDVDILVIMPARNQLDMEERGLTIPYTHNLVAFLPLLIPH
jgi:predicted nucleotidyltransferase